MYKKTLWQNNLSQSFLFGHMLPLSDMRIKAVKIRLCKEIAHP